VAAVVIVVMHPAWELRAAVSVAEVEPGVGPFVGQGAVESFDFAVGLGPVRSRPSMFNAFDSIAKCMRSIAGSVVGQHISNDNAALGEPGVGPQPEVSSRLFAFVCQDFGVDEPRVGVDGGVQKMIAAACATISGRDAAALIGAGVLAARGLTELAPAAAGGDLAEFLDIDVHQVAGTGRFHPADDSPGWAVQPAEFGQAVAGQDAVHGGDVESEQVGDARRPPSAGDAHFDDAAFGAGGRLVRAAVRS